MHDRKHLSRGDEIDLDVSLAAKLVKAGVLALKEPSPSLIVETPIVETPKAAKKK
jgi:hypothetical protein